MLQKVSQQQHIITTMAYYTIVKSLSENCATESITATTHHHHGILHYICKVPLRELLQESITATTHHVQGILHYNQVPLRELCYRKYHSNNTSRPGHNYTIVKSCSENCATSSIQQRAYARMIHRVFNWAFGKVIA